MRKIVCLLLIVMMIPTIAFGATASPTARKLIYNKSNITVLMENNTRIFDRFDAIEGLHEKLVELFDGEDFLIDDLFMIIVDKEQKEPVKWHFTREYTSGTKVIMIVFNEEGYQILEGRLFLKYVVFDFSKLALGAYDVVILSK